MTLFDMSGKVAVITGSSRGIGRAIAEHMAEHGARVVISSRKQDVCDEVAKAINDKAGKQVALSVAANISTKDDLKHLVEETNRVFGTIDTLVCNAASNPYYGPQGGISDDQFRKILDNNIVANHWLISPGRAADDRTQGRLDHHRLLDRRIKRIDGARRLCDFESRRHAARAQSGLRIRPSTIFA